METARVHRGFLGIMEKTMETTGIRGYVRVFPNSQTHRTPGALTFGSIFLERSCYYPSGPSGLYTPKASRNSGFSKASPCAGL